MTTEIDPGDSAQFIRILKGPDPDLAQKRSKPTALTGSADTGHRHHLISIAMNHGRWGYFKRN